MVRLTRTIGSVSTALVVFGGLSLCAPSLRADVILDSFPGNQYYPNSGFLVGGPSGPLLAKAAAQFTLSQSAVLDSLEVPIFAIYPYPQPSTYIVDFQVLADNNGLPGTTVLDSYQFTKFGYFGNGSGDTEYVVSGISSQHPTLAAGTPYWLAASGENDTFATWAGNTLGNVFPAAVDYGGGYNYVGAGGFAFRLLSANSVPEPGSYAILMGFAVGGLSLARRRRR